jgi:hypothetical protein
MIREFRAVQCLFSRLLWHSLLTIGLHGIRHPRGFTFWVQTLCSRFVDTPSCSIARTARMTAGFDFGGYEPYPGGILPVLAACFSLQSARRGRHSHERATIRLRVPSI